MFYVDISFNFLNILWSKYYYFSYFEDEET